MASMFSKEETKQYGIGSQSEPHTIIGSTVKAEGTISSEENIIIEGEVVGTIITTKDLTVGASAKIQADITAANMHISGEVRGNVQASGTVEMTRSSKVFGDITTNIISVETGAVLQGKCVTGQSASASTEHTEKEPVRVSKKVAAEA